MSYLLCGVDLQRGPFRQMQQIIIQPSGETPGIFITLLQRQSHIRQCL